MPLYSREIRIVLLDRKLLILDLDETLIYATKELLDRPADFVAGRYFVYKRPFLHDFLVAVRERFDLAVWTSASEDYARKIVSQIFEDESVLKFVWSCERCTRRLDIYTAEYYWVKDLKKVKRAGYALEQVLMLDDSPEKLERQYGNYIRLLPFLGKLDDTELRDIVPFLDYLRTVENVRTIEKRHWRTFRPQENYE